MSHHAACNFSFSGLSYLHKRMTVQSESSTGDLFEALADIGQGASSQDLWLVVHDESQGNTEKNLGALIEKTIPDPQNCLPAKDTRNGCSVTHFSSNGHSSLVSFPYQNTTSARLNWEDVNVEADKPT